MCGRITQKSPPDQLRLTIRMVLFGAAVVVAQACHHRAAAAVSSLKALRRVAKASSARKKQVAGLPSVPAADRGVLDRPLSLLHPHLICKRE